MVCGTPPLSLSTQSPILPHLQTFIDGVWHPLRDPKLSMREAAVQALKVRAGCRGGEGVSACARQRCRHSRCGLGIKGGGVYRRRRVGAS